MKVLIIGLGSIARKHISALQDFKPKNLQLFALRSGRNSQSISRVTDIFDYATAYKISPDFIMISNNTSQHVKTILAVIEWGIPLFIEKPLSHTLNGIDQLFQKLIDHKTKSYIACNLRHLEVIQYLKHDLLQKIERINEVNVYCGSYLPSWRPNVNFRKSYSSNEELGGGVHLDLIHEIDYTYFLFGKPVSKNSLFGKRSNLK
ncbi:MAG: Gfo/Idh/MocA family oxidoreductase, partial [Saprospiraceae bacterium]